VINRAAGAGRYRHSDVFTSIPSSVRPARPRRPVRGTGARVFPKRCCKDSTANGPCLAIRNVRRRNQGQPLRAQAYAESSGEGIAQRRFDTCASQVRRGRRQMRRHTRVITLVQKTKRETPPVPHAAGHIRRRNRGDRKSRDSESTTIDIRCPRVLIRPRGWPRTLCRSRETEERGVASCSA